MSITVQSVSQQQLGLQTGDGVKSQPQIPAVVWPLTCNTSELGVMTDADVEGDDVTTGGEALENGSEAEGDTDDVCPLH